MDKLIIGKNKKNNQEIDIDTEKPKKYKTIEKIFSQLKSKMEKIDIRLQDNLKEINNKSIQEFLINFKKTNLKRVGLESSSSQKTQRKFYDDFIMSQEIKFSNLFESLPNFNNTIYRKSIQINTDSDDPILISNQLNIKKDHYKFPVNLPQIRTNQKKKTFDNYSINEDFCQNATHLTMLMNISNSPLIKQDSKLFSPLVFLHRLTNSQSNLKVNTSHGGTTDSFKVNTNSIRKRFKNKSLINFKNIKSHYTDNFRSKLNILNDHKKTLNILNLSNQIKHTTIIEKKFEYKNALKDIISRNYVSTEEFNQISPRRPKFDHISDISSKFLNISDSINN